MPLSMRTSSSLSCERRRRDCAFPRGRIGGEPAGRVGSRSAGLREADRRGWRSRSQGFRRTAKIAAAAVDGEIELRLAQYQAVDAHFPLQQRQQQRR